MRVKNDRNQWVGDGGQIIDDVSTVWDRRYGPHPTEREWKEIQRMSDIFVESVIAHLRKKEKEMANSTYEVREIRFRFLPDCTECSVICGPATDGMLGVQGAHTKVFSKERDALSILQNEVARQDYLTGDGWRIGL